MLCLPALLSRYYAVFKVLAEIYTQQSDTLLYPCHVAELYPTGGG
jgi:hypothetical protein